MAEIKDIVEDAYFKTSQGRIGRAYAVTARKKEAGLVYLIFEGPEGFDKNTPSGVYKIEGLTLVKKPKP